MSVDSDKELAFLRELFLRHFEATERKFREVKDDRHEMADKIAGAISEVAVNLRAHERDCYRRTLAILGGSVGINGFLVMKVLGWI